MPHSSHPLEQLLMEPRHPYLKAQSRRKSSPQSNIQACKGTLCKYEFQSRVSHPEDGSSSVRDVPVEVGVTSPLAEYPSKWTKVTLLKSHLEKRKRPISYKTVSVATTRKRAEPEPRCVMDAATSKIHHDVQDLSHLWNRRTARKLTSDKERFPTAVQVEVPEVFQYHEDHEDSYLHATANGYLTKLDQSSGWRLQQCKILQICTCRETSIIAQSVASHGLATTEKLWQGHSSGEVFQTTFQSAIDSVITLPPTDATICHVFTRTMALLSTNTEPM